MGKMIRKWKRALVSVLTASMIFAMTPVPGGAAAQETTTDVGIQMAVSGNEGDVSGNGSVSSGSLGKELYGAAEAEEWDGTVKVLKSGTNYVISEGNDVTFLKGTGTQLVVEAGAVLDIRGSLTFNSSGGMDNHGSILGSVKTETGCAVINYPGGYIEEVVLAGGNCYNSGTIDKITVESGYLCNQNAGLIQELVQWGGNVNNMFIDPDSYSWSTAAAPVIMSARVNGGSVANYDNYFTRTGSEKILSVPAIIENLWVDMSNPQIVISNFHGGYIENCQLDGRNVDNSFEDDETAAFENYLGGVIDKLDIAGNAGYRFYNGNDSEYGVPVIREVVTDGDYCWIENDNGGRIDKAVIWYNSTLINYNRATVGTVYVHESTVKNTFSSKTGLGGVISEIYASDWSSVNNLAPAHIEEIFADDSGNGRLYISGVGEEEPDGGAGTIGGLYYRVEFDKNASGDFSAGAGIITAADAGSDFNGMYALAGQQAEAAFQYAGSGRLTQVLMNEKELTETEGRYIFTMPYQNAVLSAKERALSDDATLKGLTYSINGGTPAEVPDFDPAVTSYYVTLPRSVPRDAHIVLDGICTDENAGITGKEGVELVYGASRKTAQLTVTAENGNVFERYEVYFFTQSQYPDMDVSKLSVIGIGEGESFVQKEMPEFTAVGYAMDIENPAEGDNRIRPVSWMVDGGEVLKGDWTDGPFTQKLDLGRLTKGPHTLTVQFEWEQFEELFDKEDPSGVYGWVTAPSDIPEDMVKTISFMVEPVTYDLTVHGGTGSVSGLKEGERTTIKADAPPEGYVFDKWVLSSESAGHPADAEESETDFIMGAGHASVSATYKAVVEENNAIYYTLDFDTDGGKPIPANQGVEQGERPSPVDVPRKDGYVFLGWYEGETKIDLEYFIMPAENVTLKARWEKRVVSPKTGDELTQGALWSILILFCGGGLVTVGFRRKKRQ